MELLLNKAFERLKKDSGQLIGRSKQMSPLRASIVTTNAALLNGHKELADDYIEPLILACGTRSPKLITTALDCIQKLIAQGYLRGSARNIPSTDNENDKSSNKKKQSKNKKQVALLTSKTKKEEGNEKNNNEGGNKGSTTKKVVAMLNPAEVERAALAEASALLNDDDLLGDKGGDLLSQLDAITSSTSTASPPAKNQDNTSEANSTKTTNDDDLFDMLGSGGGTDIVGSDVAQFDFDSYISNASSDTNAGDGGLFS
mmetsp:Transcript_21186/g.27551  ORF Transcript_21186/g.27551 Transcript_21186/m.27551 type:complete len:258 (+) Transcript_21186:106-879(+)